MPDIPDRVQAAADQVRRRALAATPGIWSACPVAFASGQPVVWEIQAQDHRAGGVIEWVVTHQHNEGGGIEHEPNVHWITTVQPRTGLLLADYLDRLAGRLRMVQTAGIPLDENADLVMLALVDALAAEQA